MDAIVSARLLDVRFEKVSAAIGPGAKLKPGGKLDLSINSSLRNEVSSPRKAIAKLELEVTALPSEAKDESQYAFKVEIVCLGLYDWPTATERPNLKDKGVVHVLSQPMYVLAVTEATRLFRSFKIGGSINLPWDPELAGEDEPVAKKPPKKARAPSKKPAKPKAG